ncbi:MAG: hypothetical protein Q8S16_02675 [Polaromonas sp.]|nr:hypothetical protein [Polaromonas sp.]MDP3605558.1 hypothetical protein [Polaromonas sp.]
METTIRSGSSNGQLVTGLFPDRHSAEAAYGVASQRGYSKGDMNVIMSDDTRKTHFSNSDGIETELGTKAAEGAGVGGAIGGTLGAIAAAIAAVGTTLALPGLGLVIAGPIAAAVAGAGAGAAGGGLLGALVGWSMPEERVRTYEDGLKNGGILMGIQTKSTEDAEHFEREWKTNQGQHVYR